jgi:D-beta-D-heptose 7-phosphate kinase/D-beta-D-heptose 1-phosphate adenosyltransferase
MMPKVIVAVSGGFDPLHLGHLRHMQLAKRLGDYLIVMVNPDRDMVRKKGYCLLPLEHRVKIIRELRCVDEVVVIIDKDGTCAETLKMIRPDIFAKGGDRAPDNMPENEIRACQEVGCKIVYGVGAKIASSQDLVKKVLNRGKVIERHPSENG